MQLEQMYQEIILDHYKHPHGKGLADQFSAEVHHVNPTCGDEITLRISIDPADSSKLFVSYENQGCSISQASASILFDQLNDCSLEQGERAIEHLIAMLQRTVEPDEDILGDGIALVGVAQYPARVKCALLAWMAWKDAAIQAIGSTGK
ncbi:MAG: SUF system NifU family Fe-S cluster assembly protein [Actinomycetales bacterium]|nr:SUF system NifU family Fe-S cluster assembly protein [Actinomycetales bacterium]